MTARPAQLTLDDIGQPLHDATFVVVDLETTGGSAARDAITEVGAVKVRGGEVLGEFRTLVDPGTAIDPYVQVLTGITDSMVSGAPAIDSVLPAFLESSASGRRLSSLRTTPASIWASCALRPVRSMSCGHDIKSSTPCHWRAAC